MVGLEGVLVAFQSLSTIKKGTSHFNFQSNELECVGEEKMRERNKDRDTVSWQ
jgi:hypothetical protein